MSTKLSKTAKSRMIRFIIIGASIEFIGFVLLIGMVFFSGQRSGGPGATESDGSILFQIAPGLAVMFLGSAVMIYGIITAQMKAKQAPDDEAIDQPQNLRPPRPY